MLLFFSSQVGSYECVCLEGYTGLDCEMDIDDCRGDFCHNGARCEDLVNAYVCHCLPGFAGSGSFPS